MKKGKKIESTNCTKLSDYKFDTSSYVFMKMDVKRDTNSGRLVPISKSDLTRTVGRK